ncbi:hypothetical protein C5S53_08600 [Methanophagales archaeon]|nr:hypothetical protein C5S53_08600 [Methanophagales archaeon]
MKKGKMKKEIVAILAIVVGITTLLTVAAVSNDGGYSVSPCEAIDTSLGNATVTDFLNATNMTYVQVCNYKGYKGENTWMVQWSSSNRSMNVYVNVATGNILGIDERTDISQPRETKTWNLVDTIEGSGDKTTRPFTIKGDEWRINYTVKTPIWITNSSFRASVYSEDQAKGRVTQWDCDGCSCDDTEYIDEGNGEYHIKVTSDVDNWKLVIEDYY